MKDAQRVLVCLGNPPYGRHESAEKDRRNRETTGGWVRYGDKGETPILESFLQPARDAGLGVHLKNLYNLYIYFMRWALWKVFEHSTATGPGIVSFITASSYIDGDAFSGVREHLRRICDHVDIIDLGGEGRGTRKDENVFAIQTPVAIFTAWRKARKESDIAAKVRYTKIEGTREEKLQALKKIKSFADIEWQDVPNDWQAPFRPLEETDFSNWPNLTDLFPWQSNGVQCKRTWPIAPDKATLELRWRKLLESADRSKLMKESGDRTVKLKQIDVLNFIEELPPIESLKLSPPHAIVPYSFRSFDRQYLLADNRLISRPRPQLWTARSEKQFYIASMLYTPLGKGPAVTACADIPDLHFFANRGAKDIVPLYLDSAGDRPNTTPELLKLLGNRTTEQLAGYVYCVLAHPEYTERFVSELANRSLRVPITKNEKLFDEAAEFGKALIWLQTYGERMHNSKGRPKGKIPKGEAKCIKGVAETENGYPQEYSYNSNTKTIVVGDGKFSPVTHEVWEFEVSGFKVVQSWLGYRMKDRKGKKSSPLDDIHPRVWSHDFTREFLELLWVLEKTIEGYPAQKKLFERVLKSDLYTAEELPRVPEEAHKGPNIPKPKANETSLWDDASN